MGVAVANRPRGGGAAVGVQPAEEREERRGHRVADDLARAPQPTPLHRLDRVAVTADHRGRHGVDGGLTRLGGMPAQATGQTALTESCIDQGKVHGRRLCREIFRAHRCVWV